MSRKLILLVEDDVGLRDALQETLSIAGHDVRVAADGGAALEVLAQTAVSAVITDFQMAPMDGYELLRQIRVDRPDLPVLLMTAHGTIEHAVKAMLAGATDYIGKPFVAQLLIEKLAAILPDRAISGDMIAEDPASIELLDLASRVAHSDTTVLLTGESGVGKEVLARFIHRESRRFAGPFVALNCAAIPENMLEAMLFGHEKGAFTGAHTARAGKFEQAQGGTLLLDEISEMDLDLQAKLLRVLQEREVERIGAHSTIPLDVRVLATTNRDLAAQVTRKSFREDLFYRLSVFPIHIPPLRQRRGDILPLTEKLLQQHFTGSRAVPRLSNDAIALLLAHNWPGNVRELQNVMQRAAILTAGPVVESAHLHLQNAPPTIAPPGVDAAENGLQDNLQHVEGQLILDALQQGRGSRKRAAEILGISPRTLRYKLARLRDAGFAIPQGQEMSAFV